MSGLWMILATVAKLWFWRWAEFVFEHVLRTFWSWKAATCVIGIVASAVECDAMSGLLAGIGSGHDWSTKILSFCLSFSQRQGQLFRHSFLQSFHSLKASLFPVLVIYLHVSPHCPNGPLVFSFHILLSRSLPPPPPITPSSLHPTENRHPLCTEEENSAEVKWKIN